MLLELFLTHPYNTVVLTVCICMVIFMVGAVSELVIKAIKGESKGSKHGPG